MIARGEIYYIKGPKKTTGSEQAGSRPGIIVSNNTGNQASTIAEVVYLTGTWKRPLPTHVKIRSCRIPSIALCEQVDTVSQERIGRFMGHVTEEEQAAVDRALRISLGLEEVG